MELATHGIFQGHEAAEVGALGLSTLPCEAPKCVRQVLAASFRSVRFGWCVVVRAGRGTLFAVDGHSPALAGPFRSRGTEVFATRLTVPTAWKPETPAIIKMASRSTA
jgi:hypothetical protein